MNVIRKTARPCLSVRAAAGSMIGTRAYQQDFAYLITDGDQALGVLCDGMGGMEGGELASSAAARAVAEAWDRERPQSRVLGFLAEKAEQADRKVAGLTGAGGRSLRAGTTLLAAEIRGNTLSILSVGDSRIYLIRGEEILRLTEDHNYLLELTERRRAGRISQADFEREAAKPAAEALISYIGMKGLARMDRREIGLESGDIVLMCSDGLYKCMSDEQILAMVRDNEIDMEIAADRLLIMASRCASRGQDNTTVILMEYSGGLEEG